MSRLLAAIVGLGLVISLGGCAVPAADGGSPTALPTPTPDQSLVPTQAPATIADVDPETYSDGFGWYSFKVGDGPAWCTIATDMNQIICEQNEATAVYAPIPAPADCSGSYGYQLRLWSTTPASGATAEFVCATGQFQDPSQSQVLPSGSRINVPPFSCYVQDITARCDNESGQWMALGRQTWSLHP
ncbi:hypothetical protein [Rhodoluna sp.]|uniref:hypothetical protein n=1 Tax=Rhodoluna sp. TaxID=1969481 RepID=UPI0025D3094B|nr:hypothetical protein [Rhodoluna sp.]